EGVGDGTILLQRRIGAASLHRLRLGTPELSPPEKRQVGAEVHPPGQPLGQIVVGEQRTEHPGARPVVLLVLDVGERVHTLPVRGGLEDEVSCAVERHAERVVAQRLAVDPVASAEALVAANRVGGGADSQAGAQPMVEIESRRPAREVLPLHDSALIELAPAEDRNSTRLNSSHEWMSYAV